MKRFSALSFLCLGAGLALLLGCGGALAQGGAAAAAEPLRARPQVLSGLQAAQESLNQKKFADALTQLSSLDALTDKTPAERYLVQRLRAAAASAHGDLRVAAEALEAVLDTGLAPQRERLDLIEVLAGTQFRRTQYAAAAQWAGRYYAQGGQNLNLRLLQAQSAYQVADYAAALQALQALLQAQRAGQQPASQAQLELMASCHLKLKDEAGYKGVLELLLERYPKKDYWADLLARIENQPGFAPERLIDLRRLAFHVGAFEEADEYLELAQLAVKAGFPLEARAVLERGTAAGLLGQGPRAQEQQGLRDQVARLAQADLAPAPQTGLPQDANALFALGYNLVLQGQQARGLELMALALERGVKRADEARLRLGAAWVRQGDKAAAARWLAGVTGADGARDLARLWSLGANAP